LFLSVCVAIIAVALVCPQHSKASFQKLSQILLVTTRANCHNTIIDYGKRYQVGVLTGIVVFVTAGILAALLMNSLLVMDPDILIAFQTS
jgi:hypothetical protein